LAAIGDKLALMSDAGLDATCEEGQRATGISEQDLQVGKLIEDAGEEGTGDSNGCVKREAKGERWPVRLTVASPPNDEIRRP
jgi:hypothetical protein